MDVVAGSSAPVGQVENNVIDTDALIKRGYRRVSNKYGRVARIDRPDWVQVLAIRLHRAPADFYVPGEPNPTGSWCDFYRRTYSEDVLEMDPTLAQKIPSSCHDPVGYVE